MRIISTALLMLTSFSCYGAEILNGNEERQVLSFIESIRDKECWGAGFIDLHATGQINNSKHIAVVYSYQIGKCRDSNHWQYLAIFKASQDGTTSALTKSLINPDTAHFDHLEIQKNKIILTGKSYLATDPRCCPSGNARVTYTFSQDVLQKITP